MDSGSAVTAVPWNFGDCCDTVSPDDDPNLRSVTGAAIECWGERTIPCRSGEKEVTLKAHVADIAHPVISVSKMNGNGVSVWLPAENMKGCWLVTEGGEWHSLEGHAW